MHVPPTPPTHDPPTPPTHDHEQAGSRVRASLLGLALGDAIGAPFEGRRGIARDEVEAWLRSDAPLRWTDDTHMALALGETLRHSGTELDLQVLGDAFAAAYEDEPWRGYGAGPPQVFALVRGGMSYVEAAGSMFGGSGSFGNGAAMRVAPVAIVAHDDLDRAVRLAAAQARVTHTHPEAIDGAVLVTAVCILLARGGPERPAVDAVRAACRYLDDAPMRRAVDVLLAAADDPSRLIEMAAATGTGVTARESVPAAVAALLSASDHLDVILNAVLLGGDTDTIAAMAGAMAAARHGPDGLSDRQLARLEARERLWELATALGRG